MCQIKNVTDKNWENDGLETGDYVVCKNKKTFSFVGMCSCSAIIFKGKQGYAAFHYPAGVLVHNSKDEDMEKFFEEIKSLLNGIDKVIYHTPIEMPMASPQFTKKQIIDQEALETFFKTKGIANFLSVDTLHELIDTYESEAF